VWVISNAAKRPPRLTISFLVALALTGIAQPAAFEPYVASSWTHKDALPSTLIHAITQTRDGYLWLGTSDGLFRFDGITFLHERLFSDGNLVSGAVTALCAGKDGALWAGSGSGVVIRIKGAVLQKYGLGAEIEAIVRASDGDIWVIAQNGLYRFDETPQGKLLPAQRIDSARVISSLASSTDEVSLEQNRLGPVQERAVSYTRRVILDGSIFFLNETQNGPAWLGKHSFFGELDVPIVLRDSRGYVWTANSESGLIRTSAEGGQPETELANDIIESLFQDREGNIWAGTNSGLFRFRFGKIFPLTKGQGLSSDRVSALDTTRSTVWVGTQAGLNRIDNLRVQCFMRGLNVLTVKAVQNDELWVGTDGGVFTVTGLQGAPNFQRVTRDLSSVTVIEKGRTGCIWLLDSQKGLYLWQDGALVPTEAQLNIGAKTITAIRAQGHGTLWVGFLGGGFGVYKKRSFHDLSIGNGLPTGTVNDIYVDASGSDPSGPIWLGTDTGLYCFDGKHFVVWNTENGLPTDRVLWLQAEGDDVLWLGFSTGVARVRRSDLRNTQGIRSRNVQYDFYDSGDGLFANPGRRSQAAASMDSEGKLWFTTWAGVAVLDSRHIEKNSLPPPVVIERVIADHRDVPIGPRISFPPLTRDLQIDYAGLSFVVPRKVQFRYQLEGYDKEWQNAGTRRQAFYTNLPPGHYRFHVIAANNDGVWNQNGASLNLAILPAFYQTRLFTILCVLAAAAIAWGFYKLRLRQMQAAWNARFEERLAERTRIAQDLHDELLQSAMGVSLQVELTDALLEDAHTAKPHLQRALTLARELMHKGREVLRDLREKKFDTADIAKVLSNTMVAAQQNGGPAYRLTVEGQPRPVNPLIAGEFAQIGCQAIVNAFQHSTAENVMVCLSYGPAELRLEVKDNGCGIDPHVVQVGKPGHYGLIGMRERAERIGGTLTIASRLRVGTTVRVAVPGKRAYRVATS